MILMAQEGHEWAFIMQPFALMIAIEMQPQISKIPTFLKYADTLVRDVEQLRLPNDTFFIAMDVTKLYPSIDLEDCIEKMAAYQVTRTQNPHPDHPNLNPRPEPKHPLTLPEQIV